MKKFLGVGKYQLHMEKPEGGALCYVVSRYLVSFICLLDRYRLLGVKKLKYRSSQDKGLQAQ